MIRSVAVVSAALRLAAPHLPEPVVAVYAPILQSEGKARRFDPLTVIAIVNNETGGTWNPRLVDKSAQRCVGLGQICLSNFPVCRDHGFRSAGCQKHEARLLHGPANLRAVAALITANRAFCRRKTGQPALFARWLASYQGANRPGRGVWCGMKRDRRGRWRDVPRRPVPRRVMAYRRSLIRRLGRGP